MKRILQLLNSRETALWLLVLMIGSLMLSTLVPDVSRLPEGQAELLAREAPLQFWLGSHLSTPAMVKTPVFIATSLFLFVSTLVCTVLRLQNWWRLRTTEFDASRAFSFSVDGAVACAPAAAVSYFEQVLHRRRWHLAKNAEAGRIVLVAERGIALGFWGSIIFHVGLLGCFVAGAVSALTTFDGNLVLAEGSSIGLSDGTAVLRGNPADLPVATATVEELRGVYAGGRFKLDFGGKLRVSDGAGDAVVPFSVNEPAHWRGFQFSLQEYGYSPQVAVRRGGALLLDALANLRHADAGDYFPLDETGRERLFLLFFPDFIQEGSKVGSRSQDLRNPVLLFRIDRDDKPVARGLLKAGETLKVGDYSVAFSSLHRWAGLSVSREHGLGLLIAAFLVATAGLALRFLSNERRLEVTIEGTERTAFRLRGYSRYYPAFLEREVRAVASDLTTSDTTGEPT